jgi:hypothetical protein
MMPLGMRVFPILVERLPERRFPTQEQPRQPLPLHGTPPPLRVGVQIGGLGREWDPRDPGRINNVLTGGALLPIPVMHQVRSRGEESAGVTPLT